MDREPYGVPGLFLCLQRGATIGEMSYIIISPDGELTEDPFDLGAANDSKTLSELQTAVGGYIELFRLSDPSVVAYVDEDGRGKDLQPALIGSSVLQALGFRGEAVVGPVVLTGWDDEQEAISLMPDQLRHIRRLHSSATGEK